MGSGLFASNRRSLPPSLPSPRRAARRPRSTNRSSTSGASREARFALAVAHRADSAFELLITSSTDPRTNLRLERRLLHDVDRGLRAPAVRLWINDECLVRGPHRSP